MALTLSKNLILLTAFIALLVPFTAQAESMVENIENVISDTNHVDMPSVSNETSGALPMAYPVLNMTQDKSEMIKLKGEAASVVVGNPNHINVMLDTPTTLIVVPRKAGASHFSVVGQDGNIIMQRHVVVGAPKEKYVRIRRSCNASSGRGCQKTSTYFCPDTCHEVQENAE